MQSSRPAWLLVLGAAEAEWRKGVAPDDGTRLRSEKQQCYILVGKKER